MLLGTTLIDEHVLVNLPDEQKVTDQKSALFAIEKQHNVSTNSVFTKGKTLNANTEIHLEINDDQRSTINHSHTARDAKQELLEHFSVTFIMVSTKATGLLRLGPDLILVTQECLPAKGIVEAISNRPFFIIITNTSTGQQLLNKQIILGRLNDDLSTIFNTEASQKSTQYEQSPTTVVGTMKSEEESLVSRSQNKKKPIGASRSPFLAII